MPGYFRQGESNPLPTGWGFRTEERYLPYMDPERGAQWQGNAGVMGEREQTRERVEPQWQVPWQGNADFLTGVPNTDQREGFQYDIGIDGNTESFNFDEELTPQGMEAFRGRQGITSDPLRRENMMIPPPMRDRYPAELGPDGQMRLKQEEVPQTQRPAKPTKEFPWGQSIADSFMGGLRKVDESSFWREDGSPSDAWQQLKNALTGPRDPEVGRQFNQGPAMLPSFPVL